MAALPLLTRIADDETGLAYLTPKTHRDAAAGPLGLVRPAVDAPAARMPARALEPGEQYRFHFDMRKCIACKCCVVACNEQNGNPATINWRRVTEIEAGHFPNATRAFLSMGCNHCLEPTCLEGCPVDAYTKDPVTGIVQHSADACIGCQYCTWNCSYGVPQYNPERGVVGKCDMCHGRLTQGQTPACVAACPEGAIEIEIVKTADWRAAVAAVGRVPPAAFSPLATVANLPLYRSAHDIPGFQPTRLPAGDHSLSTTRVTARELPPNAQPVDVSHVHPEHPHWPLVVMTVLTQLSVGAFATIWLLNLFGATTGLGIAALASLAVGGLALSASTLHLGRPAFAYRALRMWRRSWLSREVLLFSLFSAIAGAYAGVLWLGLPGGALVGALTVMAGVAGVTASACIYRVPSRPAWNTPFTLVQFNLTAGVLGPLFAAAVGAGQTRWLAVAAAVMAGGQFLLLALRFLRCIASDSVELRGTARLLSTVLRRTLLVRGVLLAIGAVALPLVVGGSGAAPATIMVLALLLALGGEIVGRYLFFVSVVPKHMAAPYLAAGSEAA
jgi:Fe-S-cluster-containing dehydrogenase component/DMSO reductase anchor subunit